MKIFFRLINKFEYLFTRANSTFYLHAYYGGLLGYSCR